MLREVPRGSRNGEPSEAERAWNDELWPVLVIETAAGSEGRSGASRGEFFGSSSDRTL